MNVFETLPPISPRMGFLRTVSGWLDAALVEFGPEGTMHYAQSALQGGAENLFTSGMEERQVIFGDTRPLEDALRAVDAARAPGLLFLTSSPVSEIIGADLEQVRRQLQPGLRARLSVWDRVPVQGTEQDGQRSAYAAGADYLRTLPPKADRGAAGGVVVLGLDQTDWNGRSDLNELRRMFADYFGLACRNDPQGRYRLEELRSARLLLAASPAALPLAEAAQALWGVPVCRGLPYGVRGSARLVESVSRLLEQAPSPAWSADRREAEQAVREFQFALRPWPKRELRLCVRPERAACLASFLSGELKLSVSTPPEHAFLMQPPAGAVLLGSGILCRLYPQHPSLCLDTPVLHQQLFSTHLPFAGIRGTANLLSALYPLLTEDV